MYNGDAYSFDKMYMFFKELGNTLINSVSKQYQTVNANPFASRSNGFGYAVA